MKKLILLLLIIVGCSPKFDPQIDTPIEISADGNAYVEGGQGGIVLSKSGITSWSDNSSFSFYFKPDTSGTIQLAFSGKNNGGVSKISVTALDKKFNIALKNTLLDTILIGTIKAPNNDYVKVTFNAESKEGDIFADVNSLFIGGSATDKGVVYVHDFSSYWGRRGPSVHMKYTLPKDQQIEYFYNEVTVPEGNDVIGSYFMSNGFGEGYFGMQVNSTEERRILFSVWSPFDTQDPKLIPESDRIVMLRQGEGVHIGEFGNEGSGGQSYLKYMWKAGQTYKFLTKITPDGKGTTTYTAYFYATDENRWRLIASFKRPKTNTYYQNAHSFLENFIPNQGYITREVYFGNQYARDTKGTWHDVTEGIFTFDATARAGVRVDYDGGVTNNDTVFYLKNCGFFNKNVAYKSQFTRKGSTTAPTIDFEELENIK